MHKIYGWLPDLPDQRDYLYSAIKPKIRIPRKVIPLFSVLRFTMPYEYLETLAADFWTIRK